MAKGLPSARQTDVSGQTDFIARAKALGPVLAERAAHCEELRRVPDETIADFRRAGFFDMQKPRRFGGAETDPLAFFDVCLEISKHCGSSGWVLNILGAHTWRLAHFPPAAANDVWSRESSQSDLVAASFPSRGQVEPADGGYRIRGRWPFSSGVDHAGWSYLAVDVPVHDGARNLQHTFLVPRTDYRIEDIWHAAGLKGTGTNLIVVDDAYVPEHRTLCEADNFLQWPGPNAAVDEDAYRYPWGMILAYSVAIPGVGLARAAVDLYRAFVRDKTSDETGNPFAQRRLAEAETVVDVVTDRMRRNLMEFPDTRTANGEALMAARARIRWEASWSVARCADVVREIYEAMGGRAVFSSSPIQRLLRDIEAVRAHTINDPERSGANYGAIQTGLRNREFHL